MDRSFTLEGLNLERFIRMASESSIPLHHVQRKGRKLSAVTQESQFLHLQALAEKGGWRFTTGRRSGTGRRLESLLRHWMLACGAAAAAIAVIAALQFVWSVDVMGAGKYHADVIQYLQDQGIRPVMPKASIDLASLRDGLEWRYPHIAWADCGWRGMTLRVTLVEGTPVGETLTHTGSGDVIARCKGVVDTVITVAGTPQVEPGDVVEPGQVLILGQERTAAEETVPVMARGQVLARVWDSAAVRMSLSETHTRETGRIQHAYAASCPLFSLWSMDETIYDQQDISRTTLPLGGLFLPFTLIMEDRMEVQTQKTGRSFEDVRQEAGEAALRALRNKIGFDDDLVDKWVDYCMIESEVLEAIATGERIINIAQPRRNGL